MYQNLEQIIGSARTLPFTQSEGYIALDTIKLRHAKGTDLSLGHPLYTHSLADYLEAANEGAILLHSPEQLSAGFLFIKSDAGRGLLGGQKAVYASYYGSELSEDAWFAGAIFKSFRIAATSIGNLYRAEGYR